MPVLGRAVPAHRMRTASQLRENSQGSPWYAACFIWAVTERETPRPIYFGGLKFPRCAPCADEQGWDEFLGRLDQILEAQEGGR